MMVKVYVIYCVLMNVGLCVQVEKDKPYCYKVKGDWICGGKDFLHLTRIDGGELGSQYEINIDDERLQMKTVSINPLILEIDHFLSDEECDHFISVAKKQGLKGSTTGLNGVRKQMQLVDLDSNKELNLHEMRLTIENAFDVYPDNDDILQMYVDTDLDKDGNGNISQTEMSGLSPADMKRYIDKFIQIQPEKHSRYSEQVWMYPDKSADHTFQLIQKRVSEVVDLPLDIIKLSNFQVVKYGVKGHYNAHYDSARINEKLPCCERFDKKSCRVCRYMTILFYLNDVEEGGETAFVLAGNETLLPDEARFSNQVNLYRKCSEAKLHLKPSKGKAIIWYNHFINPETKWLGEMDDQTLHGGCPVIKGEKWIGNFWVRPSDKVEDDIKRIKRMKYKLKSFKTEL